MTTPSRDLKPVILKIPLIKLVFLSLSTDTLRRSPSQPPLQTIDVQCHGSSPVLSLSFSLSAQCCQKHPCKIERTNKTRLCLSLKIKSTHTEESPRISVCASVGYKGSALGNHAPPPRVNEVTGPHLFGATKSGKRWGRDPLGKAEWNLVPQPTHMCKLHTAPISPNQESWRPIVGKTSKFAAEKRQNGLK